MRREFFTASGFPFSNRDLLASDAFRGGDQLFLSCTPVRLSKTYFPGIWQITIQADGPLISGSSGLREQIQGNVNALVQAERLKAGLPVAPDAETPDPRERDFVVAPMMTRAEHRKVYQDHRRETNHSPYAFPFTLGVGGFVYVERQGDEETNDPKQFVLQRNGEVNPGVWTQPSGLASDRPFRAMAREIIEETGLVLLDDRQKTATVVVPKFVTSEKDCQTIVDEMNALDAVALKQAQSSNIRAQLELNRAGDYRIMFKLFDATLAAEKLPPRDRVTLTCPIEVGEKDYDLRGFVAKDAYGSLNLHLPFKFKLPNGPRLLLIDCERYGRKADLKTQDEILALDRNVDSDGTPRSLVTKVLSDLVERPFRISHIPSTAPVPESRSPREALPVPQLLRS